MVIKMSTYLSVQTAEATANASGFVSLQTINPVMPLPVSGSGATASTFCLRPINDQGQTYLANDADDTLSVLSATEASSIMSDTSDGGLGLGLMPLYSGSTPAPKNDATDEGRSQAQNAIKQMNRVGMPLGVTVWLDIQSVSDIGFNNTHSATDNCDFTTAFVTVINAHGYSVGYYYGNVPLCGCSVPAASSTSSTILQTVECLGNPSANAAGNLQFISVGDNSNTACLIRWAIIP